MKKKPSSRLLTDEEVLQTISKRLDATNPEWLKKLRANELELKEIAIDPGLIRRLEEATGLAFDSERRKGFKLAVARYNQRAHYPQGSRRHDISAQQRREAQGIADDIVSLINRIQLHPYARTCFNDAYLGDLQRRSVGMREFVERPRPRRRGNELLDDLIVRLATEFHAAGGHVAISWDDEDKNSVGGPFARYLMIIWELLPADHRPHTARKFARRAKTILATHLRHLRPTTGEGGKKTEATAT